MSSIQRGQDAAEALAAAVRSLGLGARIGTGSENGPNHDVLVETPDGKTVIVEIKRATLVTAGSVRTQARRLAGDSRANSVPMLVADRITADGRDELNQAGWGWLDLRGHLRLIGPGLFVDADVPSFSANKSSRHGLNGQVGIELAALLLLDPTVRIGVRAAATVLGRAPSSVSEAFSVLRADGLVDANRSPAVPELFWELSEHWKPVTMDVARAPAPNIDRENSVFGLGLVDVESSNGWALTDTMAAARYGAPVSVRADHPPDFHVPDQSAMRRAARLLGTAPSADSRAARISVAPTPLVCSRRVDGRAWASEPWPMANPLFVALDLARDPGRGREILDMWTPGRPWHRVW